MDAQGHAGTKAGIAVNECFGCGKGNPEGMGLEFRFDDEARTAVCDFNLGKRYQGPPGHAHGGIIAVILDEAMGKINKLRQVVALTKSMEIEYVKPTPLGKDLTVVGWEVGVEGRAHTNAAEIRDGSGQVLARSRGVFIAVDAERMFREHLKEQG